jgi:gamma-glutamyltranspeptidase/glutathione hydrolase
MTGLGGAGVFTVRAGGRVEVLDAFATLPGLGREADVAPEPVKVELDLEGLRVPFQVGAASVAVPGLVAGLWELHARHGRLPLAELLRPAIRKARRGTVMTEGQFRSFDVLEAIFRQSPEAFSLVGDDRGLYRVGETFRNAALADTLELLSAEGPRAFYEGDIASGIVEATSGFLTRADLRAYRTVWRRPLEGTYRGHRVCVPAIPSLTGALLLLGLAHLEAGGPMPAPSDPPAWGRIADALRHGDRLRTEAYESSLFEEGYLERVVATSRSGSTMQCATVDAEGQVVSCTSTVGEGSGIVSAVHGFVLNNFLGEEDIVPRGALQRPGARMMTGMSPALIESPDGTWIALGAAGSARIRSALLQVISHVLDGRLSLQEAIEQPRIHVDGDTLHVETFGRTPAEIEALRLLGENVVPTAERPGFYFGGVQAVARTGRGFDAGAEAARRGAAACLA